MNGTVQKAFKTMKTANFIAGIALIAAINSTLAVGLDRSSNSFRSMTAGNGTWVAVDGRGHVLKRSGTGYAVYIAKCRVHRHHIVPALTELTK